MIISDGAVLDATRILQGFVRISSAHAKYLALPKLSRRFSCLGCVPEELHVLQNCRKVYQDNIGYIERAHRGTAILVNKKRMSI